MKKILITILFFVLPSMVGLCQDLPPGTSGYVLKLLDKNFLSGSKAVINNPFTCFGQNQECTYSNWYKMECRMPMTYNCGTPDCFYIMQYLVREKTCPVADNDSITTLEFQIEDFYVYHGDGASACICNACTESFANNYEDNVNLATTQMLAYWNPVGTAKENKGKQILLELDVPSCFHYTSSRHYYQLFAGEGSANNEAVGIPADNFRYCDEMCCKSNLMIYSAKPNTEGDDDYKSWGISQGERQNPPDGYVCPNTCKSVNCRMTTESQCSNSLEQLVFGQPDYDLNGQLKPMDNNDQTNPTTTVTVTPYPVDTEVTFEITSTLVGNVEIRIYSSDGDLIAVYNSLVIPGSTGVNETATLYTVNFSGNYSSGTPNRQARYEVWIGGIKVASGVLVFAN